MEDVHAVKSLEPNDWLDQDAPDFVLLEKGFGFLVLEDFLVEIPIVCILHDNAA